MTYEYDENHQYGLVKISATRYMKCGDRCCRSGGFPAIWKSKEDDE